MAIEHTRIVNITGALWKTVAIRGVVDAEYTVVDRVMKGQSDAEMGPVTADKVFYEVTGSITVDDEDAADFLCDNSVGVLVINWKSPGGTAETTTFGVLADATGVVFVGTSGAALSHEGPAGPTPRTRVDFVGVFHTGDTKLTDTLLSSTDA